MTQITGGEISYERRVTTGDYQHKSLKVSLNFSVDEGDTSMNMALLARSRAIELVEDGLHPPDPVKEEGMIAATNGMEPLLNWWKKLPLAKRDELKDFKDKVLKPHATAADAAIDNNLRA